MMKKSSENFRVLKIKGKLLLTLPTAKSVFRLIRDLDMRTKVWQKSDGPYLHHYTKDVLKRLVAEKFKIIDLYGYNFNFVSRLLLLVRAQFGREVGSKRSSVRRFCVFHNWMVKVLDLLICIQNMRGQLVIFAITT